MKRLAKSIALVAFAALVLQASFVSAQSDKKPMNKTMQPAKTMQDGSGTKEMMSRAFTNGFNVPSTGIALEGYCPVCYIEANKAAKGKAEFSAEYNGVTYWFVSDDVRKVFVANPKKYLPAYGGWCAFGVAVNQRFPVDPTNFKVVNGRVMLFLKNKNVDGESLWNKDEANYLQKADANWQKLKG